MAAVVAPPSRTAALLGKLLRFRKGPNPRIQFEMIFKQRFISEALAAKLTRFFVNYILIQSIPFVAVLIFCFSANEVDKFLTYFSKKDVLFLNGFAWLTLPSLIKSTARIKKHLARHVANLASLVGMITVLATVIFDIRARHNGSIFLSESTLAFLTIISIFLNAVFCSIVIIVTHHACLVPQKIGLSWRQGGEFSAFYLAVLKGSFERRGIKAELVPLPEGGMPLSRIRKQEVDFEIISAVSLVCDRTIGPNLTSIALLFAGAPVSIISKVRQISLSDLQNDKFKICYYWPTFREISDLLKHRDNTIVCQFIPINNTLHQLSTDQLLKDVDDYSDTEIDGGNRYNAIMQYEYLHEENYIKTSVFDVTNFTVPGEVLVCLTKKVTADSKIIQSSLEAIAEGYSYLKTERSENIDLLYNIFRKYPNTFNADKEALLWLLYEIDNQNILQEQTWEFWSDTINTCCEACLITDEYASVLEEKMFFKNFSIAFDALHFYE